jgi:hypothetical protein
MDRTDHWSFQAEETNLQLLQELRSQRERVRALTEQFEERAAQKPNPAPAPPLPTFTHEDIIAHGRPVVEDMVRAIIKPEADNFAASMRVALDAAERELHRAVDERLKPLQKFRLQFPGFVQAMEQKVSESQARVSVGH